jgi:hypothetical protein
MLILNVAAGFYFNRWYGPLLLGEHPDNFWDCNQCSDDDQTDARATYMVSPLYINVILSAACLFIPIRTCVLWLVPSFAVVSYSILNVSFPKPFPGVGSWSSIALGGLAIMSFLGAYRNEQMARKEWRASQRVLQQEKELVNRHAAASEMLERFCDAVVHLGPPPSFRILDPNPRLASMLLYEDDRRLQGKSIANFIASEDDYSRMVTALEEENSRNVALNLHLRDANGGEFAVTAYFSCFHDFGTDLQFVVGMVEPQERTCFSIEHVSSTSIFYNAATSGASSQGSSEAYSTTMNLFDSTDYLSRRKPTRPSRARTR